MLWPLLHPFLVVRNLHIVQQKSIRSLLVFTYAKQNLISLIMAPKRKASNQAESKKKVEEKSESEDFTSSDEEPKPKKRATASKKKDKPKALNKTSTVFDKIDFACTKKNADGDEFNLKISNWNVDGLRAWLNKGSLEFVEHEQPDVFCIQETKCSDAKIPAEVKNLDGYKSYWHCSNKEGYAGVGLLAKEKPLSVQYGIGDDEHDAEGRCITAEFEKYYVVSVYVPNAGRKLITLPKRLEWNKIFKNFIKDLDQKKPVIICGDMNVAHNEIDLTNPKTNTKNAGFTKEEREGMTDFLADGYVDTFRQFYPEQTGAYTFWSYMRGARSKNIGWRLDYFIVSEKLSNNVCDSVIRSEVFGSDHCPITLFLNV